MNNKYDKFLFLLIAVLCTGTVGGVFQLSRVVTIFLLPALLPKYYGAYRLVRPLVIFFIIFYLFCCISILWTPDKSEGFKELLYFPLHFLYLIEIIFFSYYAKNPTKSISMGWVSAVALCSIVAFWELTTGQHLSMTTTLMDYANTEFGIIDRFTAAVTFGNYNSYVTFLCYSLPWVLFQMTQSNTIKTKAVVIFALVMSAVAILFNASRGGLLTFIIIGIIWFLRSPKMPIQKTIIFTIIIFGGYFLLINYGSDLLLMIEARTGDGNLTDNNSRTAIWRVALDCLFNTLGVGTGVGSVAAALGQGDTSIIASTHSLFFEFLMQYGIFFTLVVLLFLLRMFMNVRRIQDMNRKLVLYMSFLSMPIYTIIDSGYLLSPSLYALIGTLYVFVYLDKIKFFKTINTKIIQHEGN